jgi:hypothetical protein
VLAGGQVLLPAVFLPSFSPWKHAAAAVSDLPRWNVLQWDAMAEFLPWRDYAARTMSSGLIPLWNPHVLCGTPFLANSQSAPLYPLHLIYYLPVGADTAVRLGWLAFVHLSLAGAFAYLLARDLGARPAAAAVGGAAFELSGFAVAWLELPSFISVTCWIPLVLLCVGRAAREPSWRWAAGGGAAAGMMLLAGHLQIAFYGLLAAALFGLWEWATRARRSALDARHSFALLCTVFAIGFCLAAPQVLPALELSRMSHRAGAPTPEGYRAYVELAMPVQNLVTLIAPDYYGLPGRGDFWGEWKYGPPNVMEYAGHVGAAAFLLALVGLVWGRRVSARAWLLAGIGLLALLLAAGTPLCRLFYFYVPGFAQSGSPARSLVLFCLAQAMLAALGTEWLLRRVEEDWRRVLMPLAACAAATIALLFLLQALALDRVPSEADLLRRVSHPALLRAALYAVALAGGLALMGWLFRENKPWQRSTALSGTALALVAGGLIWLGGPYNPTAPQDLAYPPTPMTAALARAEGRVATLNRSWNIYGVPDALLPPNASIAYAWRDAQGYDSLYLATYRRLADALARPEASASPAANGNIVFVKHAASPLLPLLAARYVVSEQPLSRAGLVPVGGIPGPPHLYEDRTALREAYTVTNWLTAPDMEGLERLAALPGGVGRAAVVAPGYSSPTPPQEGPPQPAALTRTAPGRLAVTVEPSRPSLLVLAEGYAPGWRARISRPGEPFRPAEVVRVNTAFQGVFLEPGPATVTWRYEPASFRVGLFAALAALAGLAAVVTTGVLSPRRR